MLDGRIQFVCAIAQVTPNGLTRRGVSCYSFGLPVIEGLLCCQLPGSQNCAIALYPQRLIRLGITILRTITLEAKTSQSGQLHTSQADDPS